MLVKFLCKIGDLQHPVF